MGYEGHVAHQVEGSAKESAYDLAMGTLMKCRCLLEENRIPIEILSTGGTGTHHLTPRFPSITEFQAGSYLVMDTEYANTRHYRIVVGREARAMIALDHSDTCQLNDISLELPVDGGPRQD